MAKGDHIYVCYPGFTHHGIDSGDGSVIHYETNQQNRKITRVAIADFANKNTVYRKKYEYYDAADTVVMRAESKLNQPGDDLFNHNSENFAYWCKTGQTKNEPVKSPIDHVPVAIATKVVAEVATSVVTETAIKSLTPVVRTIVNIGVKETPVVGAVVACRTAGSIAGIAGLASGLVTDIIVGVIFEDQHHLSTDEREARKNARTAAQIASLVGGVGGTIAATVVSGGIAAIIGTAVAAPAVLGIGAAFGTYYLVSNSAINE